ncbi:G-type lectin S-receptor-like serine/threonine-protein kinase [Tanacetum coccineum]
MVVDISASKDGDLGKVTATSTKKLYRFERIYTPNDGKIGVRKSLMKVFIMGIGLWKIKAESFREDMNASADTIENATENFNDSNKIVEGGFGRVYKGVLEDGLEVAVKWLSKTSDQGFDEFKNELISIAKLESCEAFFDTAFLEMR